MVNSSSTRSSICFSVHLLIVSHDDDFYFFILVLFLSGFFVLRVFILRYMFLSALDFGIGGSCSFVCGFSKKRLRFSLRGSDGGVGMITYSVLAQSFLTSILRVGVWIILAYFRS